MPTIKPPVRTLTDAAEHLVFCYLLHTDISVGELSERMQVDESVLVTASYNLIGNCYRHLRLSAILKRGKYYRHRPPEGCVRLGYVYHTAAPWWTGKAERSRGVRGHHNAYCLANRLTEVPVGYVVHHVNGVKTDNSPENLLLTTPSIHGKLHGLMRRMPTLNTRETQLLAIEHIRKHYAMENDNATNTQSAHDRRNRNRDTDNRDGRHTPTRTTGII